MARVSELVIWREKDDKIKKRDMYAFNNKNLLFQKPETVKIKSTVVLKCCEINVIKICDPNLNILKLVCYLMAKKWVETRRISELVDGVEP